MKAYVKPPDPPQKTVVLEMTLDEARLLHDLATYYVTITAGPRPFYGVNIVPLFNDIRRALDNKEI